MIRALRWELWVFWRRLTGRCTHNAQGLVSIDATTGGAQCSACGVVTQTWPKAPWQIAAEAEAARAAIPPHRNAFVAPRR